jgi:glycosyltransferase involved in cell wall biosynthesis
MKVLIVHNQYQQHAGEEAVVAAETQLLGSGEHEVREYFDDNRRTSGMNSIKLSIQTIWNESSRKKLHTLLTEFHPDVVHFHNIFPLISPSVYSSCQEFGIPVVQTLHNYRILCPSGTLYRDRQPCEECISSSLKWKGVLHGCYRDSRLATATVAAMLAVHHSLGTWQEKITQFIALSEFSRQKFVDGGLQASKIVTKPNFVFPDPGIRHGLGDHCLFVGRLSSEKGPDLLLKAWRKTSRNIQLRIVGDGPLRETLEQEKGAFGLDSVKFSGALEKKLVLSEIKQSRFLVVPSRCYENFPLVVAEAYACGVPVIAPRLGATGEIVRDGLTGLHFDPGNADDLANRVEWAWTHPSRMEEMGRAARAEFEAKYTAERNYQILMQIYEKAVLGSVEV